MTDVHGRLDDHEERITGLEQEERRTRERLHNIESDRHAVRRLAEASLALAQRTDKALDGIDDLAESAATRAIDKDRETRRDAFRKGWTFRIAVFAGVATAVGVGINTLHALGAF